MMLAITSGKADTIVLVAGDTDFIPPVIMALKEGIHVDVWSWRSAINEDSYRHDEHLATIDQEKLTFYYLDDVYDQIGYLEEPKQVDFFKEFDESATFFITDWREIPGGWKSIVDAARLPIDLYFLLGDLALCVACKIESVDLDRCILAVRKSLEERLSTAAPGVFTPEVLSYPEYVQFRKCLGNLPVHIESDEAYLDRIAASEVRASKVTHGKVGSAETSEDESSSFTPVKNPRKEKRRKKENRPKPQTEENRCKYRKYCRDGEKCVKGSHTYDERKFFEMNGGKGMKLHKAKFCPKGGDCLSYRCTYAHKREELRCIWCEEKGHAPSFLEEMSSCPEEKR